MRALLNGESLFRKTDMVHLIPFLLFTINYLPFYLMNLEDKSQLVLEVTKDFSKSYLDQEGLLPEWVNMVCRLLSPIVYLIMQWRLILSFFKNIQRPASKQFVLVKKWVYDLTTIQVVYTVLIVLMHLSNRLMINGFISKAHISETVLSLLVCISFLFISCYLLWNPRLLIGLPHLSFNNQDASYHCSIQDNESLFYELENYLNKTKCFLNPNLKVDTLSRAMDMPARRISQIISESSYNNFNDYINQMRITYAVKKIENNYLSTYSVEALSHTCGFNSKNAFYRAFKKAHNCTPGQYCTNYFNSPNNTNKP
ncbi:helix-turn-helix domain-containing protein [Zobellia uliginosa]|uniref:helix-turn-helix domain-containing protein n=1 Tax=Zobellia uliginosa TaxID=143224 RepID=UPI001C07139D|nr:AraC family transcriptional regulator [Zobellia uliginosa]